MSQSQTRNTQPQSTIFRDAYSHPIRVQLHFTKPSKTKQSFKDECDINNIVGRYMATGQLPNLREIAPQYLDVSEMDFQTHQNFVAEAQTMFMELPSQLRTRFNNSPAQFLDFCSHEKNRPELAEMGLLRPINEPVIPMPTSNLSTAQNGSNPSASESA